MMETMVAITRTIKLKINLNFTHKFIQLMKPLQQQMKRYKSPNRIIVRNYINSECESVFIICRWLPLII